MESYLTFVNRGLHHVAKEMVLQALEETHRCSAEVRFLGETVDFERDLLNQQETTSCNISPAAGSPNDGSKGSKKRRRSEELTASTCGLPVGSLQIMEGADKTSPATVTGGPRAQHVNVGYNAQNQTIWSTPGCFSGMVWMQIVTNASPRVMATELRCLGPLLALSFFCQGSDLKWDETQSLEQVSQQIQSAVSNRGSTSPSSCSPPYNLTRSVELWKRHAQECWKDASKVGLKQNTELGTSRLTYRLSCMRREGKDYPFKRQDLLAACAKHLVSRDEGTLTEHWKVDLKHYDIELVLFLKPKCLAIAVNLRPYGRLGVADYSTGTWPPDISSPYLSSQLLSSHLVRLRPATAQLLLHLARLQPGDVMLDPCVGMGTIAVEAQFTNKSSKANVVSLGGDLILTTENGIGPSAMDYVRKSRTVVSSSSSPVSGKDGGQALPWVDLLASDACQLPFRSEIADAVVSDLPFGVKCLSSAKLGQVLPLMMRELARVLRPETGRAILLCGSYVPVLEVLKNANDEASSLNQHPLWNLPCQAVLPVNIGGLGAWVIQVKRGCGAAIKLRNYRSRLQKVAAKREQLIQRSHGNKQRKLQS